MSLPVIILTVADYPLARGVMVAPSAYVICYYRADIHGPLAPALPSSKYSAMRHQDYVPTLNYNLDRSYVPTLAYGVSSPGKIFRALELFGEFKANVFVSTL